jgi:radical SAM superfamily enzyme YgiQ (UPF0313 family)
MKEYPAYQGVEQGPIRPPSEANSLFIRVTRNCPWNRCSFCPIYKDAKFSLRSVADIKSDIDTIYYYINCLQDSAAAGSVSINTVRKLRSHAKDQTGFDAALHWFVGGMESVFLQDANSLVVKPAQLIDILRHLRERFPQIKRITSYARSHSIAKIKEADLLTLREAGLNRLHIGLESGSDTVLRLVKKGATQAMHLIAGRKVISAGMELSEYYMPGLGGQQYSREHALESGAVLNQINPHFIRLRTLAIPRNAPLFVEYQAGRFRKCTDLMIVQETLLFLQNLQDISSWLASDHILNLFPQLEGRFPEDKPRMVKILEDFLAADPEHQRLYQVGRRCGMLAQLSDLDDP